MGGVFMQNEHGVWCPSCGELIANGDQVDDDWMEPDECRVCGFPEDIEAMADFHLGDADDLESWQ